MKHTVVFLFPLLIFNCQSSIDKDFKIKISSSDKIISNGDNIKIIAIIAFTSWPAQRDNFNNVDSADIISGMAVYLSAAASPER